MGPSGMNANGMVPRTTVPVVPHGKVRWSPIEAISEYQKAIETSGGSQGVVALAHAYSATGKKVEAEKILRDLERKLKATSASPYTMATIYAGVGENDKAFESLEEGYSRKSFEIPSLQFDLVLDNLRFDPRFQSLLRRMGLKS
jgi:hypothetical protein